MNKKVVYAINKQTKQHRICEPQYSDNMLHGSFMVNADEYTVEADADGWIEWNGVGDCPLPDGHAFEVELRTGNRYPFNIPQALLWGHRGLGGDITAYKPIFEVEDRNMKNETSGWDGEGLPPVGTVCEFNIEPYNQQEDWRRSEIVAHYNGRAVFCLHGSIDALSGNDGFPRFFSNSNAKDFRPIQTERDKWIDNASIVLLRGGPISPEQSRIAATDIYDAILDGTLPNIEEK